MDPDPNRTCPACGATNECVPARTGDFATPCWCASVEADHAAIAALPAALRGTACLCRRCLTAGVEDGGPAIAAGGAP